MLPAEGRQHRGGCIYLLILRKADTVYYDSRKHYTSRTEVPKQNTMFINNNADILQTLRYFPHSMVA